MFFSVLDLAAFIGVLAGQTNTAEFPSGFPAVNGVKRWVSQRNI